MTRPRLSSSGPPELPGLIGASVWMTLSIWKPLGARISRPRPETMPVVAVRSRPSGLPIAIAVSPTLTWSESASASGYSLPAAAGSSQDGDVDGRAAAEESAVIGRPWSPKRTSPSCRCRRRARWRRSSRRCRDEAGPGPVAGLDRDDALAGPRRRWRRPCRWRGRRGRALGGGGQRGRDGRVGVARRVVVAAHEAAAEQDGGDDDGGDRTAGECGQKRRAGLLRGLAAGRRALVDEGRLVAGSQGAVGDGRRSAGSRRRSRQLPDHRWSGSVTGGGSRTSGA